MIDRWQGPANTEFDYVAELGEGQHAIKMEFVERGGDATATLDWDSVSEQPSGTYRAHYWNAPPGVNAIPSTTPELAREEEAIDHDWGEGSPGPGIAPNRFVARWTRTLSFAPGDYEFAVTADDGVRLYVDGVRVIDRWIDQGPTTYRTTLPLDGGPHTIVMEYYENGGRSGRPAQLRRGRRSTVGHGVPGRTTGTLRTPPESRPSRTSPRTSFAATRRSTSIGARAPPAPAWRQTGSSRAGPRPSSCRRPLPLHGRP